MTLQKDRLWLSGLFCLQYTVLLQNHEKRIQKSA